MKTFLHRWRANFLTGLAIILPAVVSLAVVRWLLGTIANITDLLLVFLPGQWTHQNEGLGPFKWQWSLIALLLAMISIALIGQFARYYIGKKVIRAVDRLMLRVPLLNKIYGTIKQVNEAFSSGNKSSFQQVVLVDFPQPGQKAMGFITGEQPRDLSAATSGKTVSVFVPTTPNPTGGFLLLLPESAVTRLDMSVADGIKFIISLGAITPEMAASGGIPPSPPVPATAQSPIGSETVRNAPEARPAITDVRRIPGSSSASPQVHSSHD
ncbi:MAG TPA: DUF502 domain-containing protein [Candidatus Paceibacterota bacterium]|nr:DUF502 domain-containing protein [Verrucomicrobiota bacterium]HRY51259.1 DUF502 domain-containing protein [Candidatus Paceibacterota bacterium]HSA01793.1 DUF502 domain-containing protein [Candidatus Paceibacterota bacterium]